MKKRLFGVYLSVMLISVCVGCGGESTSTEQTEAAQTTATEESTPVHTTEQTTDVPQHLKRQKNLTLTITQRKLQPMRLVRRTG
ncbi:MAG: hypothetical protein J6J79_02785 [Lachnospiraceae bacterium]|nr:hypothetical protein [Lachnospiraceae bacterium]